MFADYNKKLIKFKLTEYLFDWVSIKYQRNQTAGVQEEKPNVHLPLRI